MVMLKSISGHTTLGKCKDYLEIGNDHTHETYERNGYAEDYLQHDGRAIAKDFLGIPSKRLREDWAATMDRTRALNGNDKPYRGKPAVTYQHFVISPDPKDGIDLPTLRELVTFWCESEFGENGRIGTFQVAAIYHDDNEHRIPHAHIIVNNTDLNSGHRLQINNDNNKKLAVDLQKIGKSLGLTAFPIERDGTGDDLPALKAVRDRERALEVAADHGFSFDREPVQEQDYEQPERRARNVLPSSQRDYKCRTVRELIQQGHNPWIEQIKDLIRVACSTSSSVEGAVRNLELMGVKVKSRRGGEDYLFIFPQPGVPDDKNKRKVSGQHLGTDFTIAGMESMIHGSFYNKLEPEDRDVEGVRGLAALPKSLHVTDISKVTPHEVSLAVQAINLEKVRTIEEAKRVLFVHRKFAREFGLNNTTGQMHYQDQLRLEALLKVAKYSDILPRDERSAKSMPRDAALVHRQLRERRKVPLQTKIARGYRLTKDEYASLTESQKRNWMSNRRRIAEGKANAAGKSKRKSTEGEQRVQRSERNEERTRNRDDSAR